MNTHSCLVIESGRRNPHTCMLDIMLDVRAMNQEFDPEKRAQLQRNIMQFYHDQASAIFSHERVQVDGLASNLMEYTVVNRTVPYHELYFK